MDVTDTIAASRTDGERSECDLERADRNMNELLQELRVAQTGVQILFAFLLTLVFQQRFADITEAQRWTYVVTLLLSVVTAGLLVAPAAVHRVTFQRGLKMETVLLGHRLFTAGLPCWRSPWPEGCCWCWTWPSDAGSRSRWPSRPYFCCWRCGICCRCRFYGTPAPDRGLDHAVGGHGIVLARHGRRTAAFGIHGLTAALVERVADAAWNAVPPTPRPPAHPRGGRGRSPEGRI
jgi:hypothetical protein